MWVYYNPNPDNQKRVGDCTVRAVAKALDISWDDAYILMAVKGYQLKDMPSANSTWSAVLMENGFKRKSIPDRCPDCFTADDFCRKNPKGIYVLGFGSHTATVVDGRLYDMWDSSNEIPQYYFYKED